MTARDGMAPCTGAELRSGTAPDRVHLLPLGEIAGRDGRRFWSDDEKRMICAQTRARNAGLPIDDEHQIDLRCRAVLRLIPPA